MERLLEAIHVHSMMLVVVLVIPQSNKQTQYLYNIFIPYPFLKLLSRNYYYGLPKTAHFYNDTPFFMLFYSLRQRVLRNFSILLGMMSLTRDIARQIT